MAVTVYNQAEDGSVYAQREYVVTDPQTGESTVRRVMLGQVDKKTHAFLRHEDKVKADELLAQEWINDILSVPTEGQGEKPGRQRRPKKKTGEEPTASVEKPKRGRPAKKAPAKEQGKKRAGGDTAEERTAQGLTEDVKAKLEKYEETLDRICQELAEIRALLDRKG